MPEEKKIACVCQHTTCCFAPPSPRPCYMYPKHGLFHSELSLQPAGAGVHSVSLPLTAAAPSSLPRPVRAMLLVCQTFNFQLLSTSKTRHTARSKGSDRRPSVIADNVQVSLFQLVALLRCLSCVVNALRSPASGLFAGSCHKVEQPASKIEQPGKL